jgi:ABC-type lipoprotein export system ATPase subunit
MKRPGREASESTSVGATAPAGASVAVESVSHAYGDAEVLHDVDLVIAPGELVALVGPSGSGKSTLLHLMGSLDTPTQGRILVDDVDVGRLRRPADFRRTTVGFVFQQHFLLPALTVAQNVELPMAAARVSPRERRVRSRELLEDVGLLGRDASLPSELSGGERQRVAVARALSNRPKLLLADEPTGSLDSVASQQIWRLIDRLRRRDGTTAIVASHDRQADAYADRSLLLVDGRLSERAPERGEGEPAPEPEDGAPAPEREER